ncbi:MAG TPA: response regulator [Anaeromyxobacter sp.]|nr:response regulator [Anaeromyxobacter sp.]
MSQAPDIEILLLEDDAAILEGLVECLELAGHRVHAVSDGAEALGWLAAGNRPRLVVLDLVMPRMGGEEFLREFRAQPGARVPVVLMTAASPGSVELPQVDAFLAKPFELDEFLRAVQRFLR